MKFERTRVCGFENALFGMRNAKNSWNKIDSEFGFCGEEGLEDGMVILHKNNDIYEYVKIGENDMKLAQTLVCAGSEHRKFLRQIQVEVTITAPLYWFKEFDTYKVGTVANSTSTMHKLASTPITIDCFEEKDLVWNDTVVSLEQQRKLYNELVEIKEFEKAKKAWKILIVNLPESWLQTRTITMNYENLLSMCSKGQRRFHKLTEWSESFIQWARSLPYAQELIFTDELQGND